MPPALKLADSVSGVCKEKAEEEGKTFFSGWKEWKEFKPFPRTFKGFSFLTYNLSGPFLGSQTYIRTKTGVVLTLKKKKRKGQNKREEEIPDATGGFFH